MGRQQQAQADRDQRQQHHRAADPDQAAASGNGATRHIRRLDLDQARGHCRRRNLRCRQAQPIAGFGNGFDRARRAGDFGIGRAFRLRRCRLIEHTAQLPDRIGEAARAGVGIAVPDFGDQALARDHAPGLFGQTQQHLGGFDGETFATLAETQAACIRIEAIFADAPDPRQLLTESHGAPQIRAQPSPRPSASARRQRENGRLLREVSMSRTAFGLRAKHAAFHKKEYAAAFRPGALPRHQRPCDDRIDAIRATWS
jgi:hypothetical protein